MKLERLLSLVVASLGDFEDGLVCDELSQAGKVFCWKGLESLIFVNGDVELFRGFTAIFILLRADTDNTASTCPAEGSIRNSMGMLSGTASRRAARSSSNRRSLCPLGNFQKMLPSAFRESGSLPEGAETPVSEAR
jgi:hypothetical protein